MEIHFLHYHTEEEAASKWYRRASRVNFDNLLVVGMEQNLCSEQDIKEFDTLPFKNKIIFTTHDYKDLKSNCFIKEFAGMESVQDPYRKADVYYKYLTNRIDLKINTPTSWIYHHNKQHKMKKELTSTKKSQQKIKEHVG